MNRKIELITASGGNLGSVRRCLGRLGVECIDADARRPPSGARPLILPGVGAFGAVMKELQYGGIDRHIKDAVKAGTPLLGICVGLQVLLSESEESPGVKGLGLIAGRVVRFRAGKVPQIGWNKISRPDAERVSRPDAESGIEGYAYFVNSYYAEPDSPEAVSLAADYFCRFPAALQVDNITAYQFHPEKSGELGESLVQEWLNASV